MSTRYATDVLLTSAAEWLPVCRDCGWQGTPTTDSRKAANEQHVCRSDSDEPTDD